MGQVTVTHPYNDQNLDADVMRAQLEALASGINSVDSSQLVDGAVTRAKIAEGAVNTERLAAAAVTMAKLGTDLFVEAKALSSSLTLETSNRNLTTWQDVTGLAFAAYRPAVDAYVLIFGCITVGQANTSYKNFQCAVREGSTVLWQAQQDGSVNHATTFTIAALLPVKATESKTFKISVKSSTDVGNLQVIASDARTKLAMIAIPGTIPT